jgi:hypothetical protein
MRLPRARGWLSGSEFGHLLGAVLGERRSSEPCIHRTWLLRLPIRIEMRVGAEEGGGAVSPALARRVSLRKEWRAG